MRSDSEVADILNAWVGSLYGVFTGLLSLNAQLHHKGNCLSCMSGDLYIVLVSLLKETPRLAREERLCHHAGGEGSAGGARLLRRDAA